MRQEQRKVKIGKYISIAIGTVFWFVLAWIIIGVTKENHYLPAAIMGVLMLIVFTSLTFGVLSYSTKAFIKAMKTFKQEKGLWKILTIVFRIAMFVFALLITAFWLVWFIYMLKNAMLGDFDNWVENCANYSIYYIQSYPLYVASFVFILIWSAAGIVFEILKKITGGYKDKKNDDSSKKVEK